MAVYGKSTANLQQIAPVEFDFKKHFVLDDMPKDKATAEFLEAVQLSALVVNQLLT
jgi:hypothetical protein